MNRIASAHPQGLQSLESDLRSVGKIEKLEIVAGEATSIQEVIFKPAS
jgi:hypothetical protein